jgi:hypothetical protein
MKVKRTIPPTGWEDYDIEQLSSYLDRSSTLDDRGKIVAELQERADEIGSTVGMLIRRGYEIVQKEFQQKQEKRLREGADKHPEPEPEPEPLPTEFDVVNGKAPYKPYLVMVLNSEWDYVDRRPKKDPLDRIRYTPNQIRQYLVDRIKDDPDGFVINNISTGRQTLMRMIIESHSHWEHVLKKLKVVGD